MREEIHPVEGIYKIITVVPKTAAKQELRKRLSATKRERTEIMMLGI